MAGGLYSPSAGDVLTAANAIDYWSKQVVIICTSGTRPASPRAGMTIYQTDTNTFAVYGTAWCEITPYSATVATSETTTSTSYTDLATAGPSVTVTTGTKVVWTPGATTYNSGAATMTAAPAVSGATTLAAADGNAITSGLGTSAVDISKAIYVSSLTAGSNVFKLQYKTNAGTSTWVRRYLTVVGIPT